MADQSTNACIVIGAGDATGGAIARAFAREGLTACVVRRPRHADALEELAASIRAEGGAGFSAFAGAKHALRALAQSMARELGSHNIHVAHVVIDGAIDTDFIRGVTPDFEAKRADDAILSPDAIAANYVMLHRQPRTAWTHELDLRPWAEKW